MTKRAKVKPVKAVKREVRRWKMLDGPSIRLTYFPKKRGEYWRRVTVELQLYEGLTQAMETECNYSLHRGWPAEWLYYNILKMVQREIAMRNNSEVRRP